MQLQKIEDQLCSLPILQYVWVNVHDLVFSERVRYVCQTECPMYGRSWSCPPAVGTVEECKERCLRFAQALVITTAAEVADITDLKETLETRAHHVEITRQVREILQREAEEVMVLSAEACMSCAHCTYPEGKPCRNPERMFPCVESYGIVATDLAEKYGIQYFNGNIVTWISILFFR